MGIVATLFFTPDLLMLFIYVWKKLFEEFQEINKIYEYAHTHTNTYIHTHENRTDNSTYLHVQIGVKCSTYQHLLSAVLSIRIHWIKMEYKSIIESIT